MENLTTPSLNSVVGDSEYVECSGYELLKEIREMHEKLYRDADKNVFSYYSGIEVLTEEQFILRYKVRFQSILKKLNEIHWGI